LYFRAATRHIALRCIKAAAPVRLSLKATPVRSACRSVPIYTAPIEWCPATYLLGGIKRLFQTPHI
jgi:hypothetical protein